MNKPNLAVFALISLSLVSCATKTLTSEDVRARAKSFSEVVVKSVELRVHTTGNGKPEPSTSSAEIDAHGTSNVPGLKGFRLVFVPSGKANLRQPYREGDHWTVLQELTSLNGWIVALKDITRSEGVSLTLSQTEDGAYTLTTLRRLTR